MVEWIDGGGLLFAVRWLSEIIQFNENGEELLRPF